ncbi:DUF5666 domain-containing protein [Agaribacterium haliotis]|uniref:DUF5666 domain-containing protein n=1 Tax=Agaribacterium haliotis TaxID=2013869 RepID=UPI000BB53DC2|nr:DUF5666 domain-containing protein [Agaribacterium haliotis]
MKKISKKLVLASAISAVLAACGSGSEGDANSAAAYGGQINPTGNTSSAVKQKATAVTALGENEASGEVVVNGKRYNSDHAQITIDGEPAVKEDLDRGMLVEVDAEEDGQGEAKAKHIRFYSKLAGEIEAINVGAQTLTVMGTEVLLTADTKYGKSIDEVTLAPLAEGVQVRISGRSNEDGSIVATRIDTFQEREMKDRLSGVIESIDTAASTLIIDGQVVDFLDADLIHADMLEAGLEVFVVGKLGETSLDADKVFVIPEQRDFAKEYQEKRVELTGKIEVEQGRFTIDGFSLEGLDLEDFENGSYAELQEGKLAVIKGSVDQGGDIDVDSVKFERPSTTRMMGRVEKVDVDNGRVIIDGKEFVIDDGTRFNDEFQQERIFDLEDIDVGDRVMLDAYKERQDGMTANELTLIKEAKARKASLHTKIESVSGQQLITVDGVVVALSEKTHITASAKLDELTLGSDGDELFIAGIYNEEGVLQAKFVTAMNATPDFEFMPRPEMAPEDKLEQLDGLTDQTEDMVKVLQDQLIDAEGIQFEYVGEEFVEFENSVKELEDRVIDHAHVMDEADIEAMKARIEELQKDVNEMPEFEFPEFDQGERPEFEGERPEFEGERSEFEGERPEFEGERSEFEGERSEFEGERPEFEGERPEFEGERPEFEGERPEFDGEFDKEAVIERLQKVLEYLQELGDEEGAAHIEQLLANTDELEAMLDQWLESHKNFGRDPELEKEMQERFESLRECAEEKRELEGDMADWPEAGENAADHYREAMKEKLTAMIERIQQSEELTEEQKAEKIAELEATLAAIAEEESAEQGSDDAEMGSEEPAEQDKAKPESFSF